MGLISKRFTVLLSLVFTVTLGYSQDYFIQPNGNDSLGSGEINNPFKTIEKGLDVISKLPKSDNMINLFLRGGKYRIQESIRLDKDVSNVNIVSYNGERVIFSGGISIPTSSIKKTILPKTKYNSHREVYTVDLKNSGILDYGKIRNVGFGRPYGASWGEIFVNNKEMHLSRWPNNKMLPMGKVIDTGSIPRNSDYSNRGGVIGYEDDRINEWSKESDVWISGYFKWGYADDMVKLAKIDSINKTFTTASPTLYGFGDSAPYRQWYGVNILSELDNENEYYIDRDKGVLYFIYNQEELKTIDFSILENPFFTIEGSENIKIEGITFEVSRGNGITMSNSVNVEIRACEFKNLGGLGVVIGKGIKPFKKIKHEGSGVSKPNIIGSLQQHLYANSTLNREGGKNNKVIGCKFYQLGAGGVSLGGGNRKSLEKGNNTVENSVFYNINRIEKSYRPAISLTGVGNRIIHCEMYNLPSMAILMHGNNHQIEYNYIHDVCLDADDQGAIYYGRDPSERGTVIRYNYFENIPDEFSTSAVYNDDGACGITVESNIFYKAGRMNILLGGGSDNIYRNNIFMNAQIGIHVDNRLQNWSEALLDKGGTFEKRLKIVDFKNPPYSVEYPDLANYYDNPSKPTNNIIENNVFLNIAKLKDGKKRWLRMKHNYVTNKNIFTEDISKRKFSLSMDSKVFNKIPEFKNIPFYEMGLYETKDFESRRTENGLLQVIIKN